MQQKAKDVKGKEKLYGENQWREGRPEKGRVRFGGVGPRGPGGLRLKIK